MVYSLIPLRQPLGSNSCLSTCVCAVLRAHGISVKREEVAEWCEEDIDGCVFFIAVNGLREAGFEVEEVRDTAKLLALFQEDELQSEPEPVIVTLKNPELWRIENMDHAVVMLNIREILPPQQIVEYMDPLDGEIHEKSLDFFLQCWEHNACYGFRIQPD